MHSAYRYSNKNKDMSVKEFNPATFDFRQMSGCSLLKLRIRWRPLYKWTIETEENWKAAFPTREPWNATGTQSIIQKISRQRREERESKEQSLQQAAAFCATDLRKIAITSSSRFDTEHCSLAGSGSMCSVCRSWMYKIGWSLTGTYYILQKFSQKCRKQAADWNGWYREARHYGSAYSAFKHTDLTKTDEIWVG